MSRLIVLLGPTGVGKTDLSIEIAKYFDTVIISSDSRQVYSEMHIGTAVPEPHQLAAVKHYCIGTKSIFDYYNASMYEFEVIDLLTKLFKIKRNVLLVGGSGMYINAVCDGIDDLPTISADVRNKLMNKWKNEGLETLQNELQRIDPEYYNQADIKNPKRVLKALEVFEMTGKTYSSLRTNTKKERNFDIVKIGLNRDREELYDRINKRVDIMIEEGLIEEARQLLKHRHLNSLNTVGYKELFDYFEEKISLEEAIDLIKRDSRRYARRQLSWFNRDKTTYWFRSEDKNEIIKLLDG